MVCAKPVIYRWYVLNRLFTDGMCWTGYLHTVFAEVVIWLFTDSVWWKGNTQTTCAGVIYKACAEGVIYIGSVLMGLYTDGVCGWVIHRRYALISYSQTACAEAGLRRLRFLKRVYTDCVFWSGFTQIGVINRRRVLNGLTSNLKMVYSEG